MTDDPKPNIFTNLANLRVAPIAFSGASKEVITRVLVQKPGKQEFFRVDPDPERHITTAVVADDEGFGRDVYLLAPDMRGALESDARIVHLVPYITRQGTFRLWPLRLPVDDSRSNAWFDTARDAVERAKERWVCLKPDLAAGHYRIFEAVGDLPAPVWPDRPIGELLELAFRDRLIDRIDHPFVRKLRGAA